MKCPSDNTEMYFESGLNKMARGFNKHGEMLGTVLVIGGTGVRSMSFLFGIAAIIEKLLVK